jgi:excisionase family DNA binding protein
MDRGKNLLTKPVQQYLDGLPALLDVRAVARELGCSVRHVYRLVESGAMPRPIRLGSLVRFNRQNLVEWISRGCPTIRETANNE